MSSRHFSGSVQARQEGLSRPYAALVALAPLASSVPDAYSTQQASRFLSNPITPPGGPCTLERPPRLEYQASQPEKSTRPVSAQRLHTSPTSEPRLAACNHRRGKTCHYHLLSFHTVITYTFSSHYMRSDYLLDIPHEPSHYRYCQSDSPIWPTLHCSFFSL